MINSSRIGRAMNNEKLSNYNKGTPPVEAGRGGVGLVILGYDGTKDCNRWFLLLFLLLMYLWYTKEVFVV